MSRSVLILGAMGMLGQELVRAFSDQDVLAWDHAQCDLLSERCEEQIVQANPSMIFNAAAYNDVDKAEGEGREMAQRLNTEVPGRLARISRDLGIPFVHYGTSYVFDGEQGNYAEDATPNPINGYGQSKLDGERAVLASGARAYVIRLSWLFGKPALSEGGKKCFVDIMLDLALHKDHLNLVNDEAACPTYAPDLAKVSRQIVETCDPGIYHVTNEGVCTWEEFAREIFRQAKVNISTTAVPGLTFPRAARRPRDSSMTSHSGIKQRTWQEALHEYLAERIR